MGSLDKLLKSYAPPRCVRSIPLDPAFRRRAVDTAVKHLNALSQRPSNGPEIAVAMYGDGLMEKLTTAAMHEHATCLGVPERTAVLAAGGDGAEHLLLRLQIYFACNRSGVVGRMETNGRPNTHVIMIGVNNLLGMVGIDDLEPRLDPIRGPTLTPAL